MTIETFGQPAHPESRMNHTASVAAPFDVLPIFTAALRRIPGNPQVDYELFRATQGDITPREQIEAMWSLSYRQLRDSIQ